MERARAVSGKATTGHRMSDVAPVMGFVIDTPHFAYFLPAEDVYKACFAGEQNVDVLIRAERVLAHGSFTC